MMRLLLALCLLASGQEGLTVDAAFPGGNIVVDTIEGDMVTLHQDLRDTQGDWFYWHFRVRGAAGRTLTFEFPKGKSVIGVLGPAASLDGGATWTWLGKESVTGNSFRCSLTPGLKEARFCLSIPYLQADLARFLERHAKNPHLRAETLCETRKGRKAERLHAGRLDGEPRLRIVLTARHHACEMIASYAMEGLLEEVLADTDAGKWYRGNVEVLALPFMDKDGVEDGDQGKNRRPRDHNRDYEGEPVHATVRAVRDFVPKWSAGKLRFAMDMHCPTLRGPTNETIYFVGSEEPENWKRILRLSEILASTRSGPLLYRASDNMPWGKDWNSAKSFTQGKTFCQWARSLPGVHAASTIEISYANANGTTVTAESARAFGRDLARAIARFLQESVKE